VSVLTRTGGGGEFVPRESRPVLLAWLAFSTFVTLVALVALSIEISLSPKLAVALALPIVAPLLWLLLRVDWPAPLPAASAAPLDRLALLLMSMAMATMTLNGVRAGGSMAVSDAFLILALAASVPALFDRRLARPVMLPGWLLLPAGVLIFIGLISMIFMDDSLVSLAGLLRLVAALLLVPLTVGLIGGTQRAIVWLIDLWIVSAMINAAVAISDYALHTTIGEQVTHVISAGRSTGLTTHSNHLGVAMCLTTPLVIGRIATARTRTQQVFLFGALCATGLAVLSTGSRGALVAFGLAALLGCWMLPPELRRQSFKMLLLAGIAGAILAGAAFRGQATQSFERLLGSDQAVAVSVDESDRERRDAREKGIEQVTGSPIFGAGLVNARDAHMIYLQLAASSGIIGLLAFLAFLIGSIEAARRRARIPDLPIEVRAAIATAGASVAIWALLGLVENQISDRYLYVPSGLVVAGIWYGIRNTSSE
jgi:O-antigen ligase